MTELKTLKDLKFNIKEKDKNMKELIELIQNYLHEEIKIEAIKWVKMYRERDDDGLGDYWITLAFQKFFNLTDEDLK